MSVTTAEEPATRARSEASPADRAAAGRAARRAAPRSAHAGWAPPADRSDPVAVLEAQSRDRVPELVPVRYGRMLASPFAFFRGAAAVMAADLAAVPVTGMQVQLCGDAHAANFGGYASPERALVFDINDFDETLPGPWEWDVLRLGASFAVAGREVGLRAGARATAVGATARAYREAMREFAAMGNLAVWYARLDVSALLADPAARLNARDRRALQRRIEQARAKDHARALAKLTHRVDGRTRFLSRPPLLVPVEELLEADEREHVEAEVRGLLGGYGRSVTSDRRHLLASYRYAHLARKVVGVGSVGTRAWVVLLTGRDADDAIVLQVKEAQASVLEVHARPYRGGHHGRRVVEGQRLMQAASDAFLGWLRADRGDGAPRDFYVRQLWDSKVSPDIEGMDASRLASYAQLCGWTLARAHARSGDRIAIAAYLGRGDAFDRALTAFAESYADQNERDHAALGDAAVAGRIAVRRDV
jgi:uncharacterized protein (DUF2252 family)